MRHNSTSKNIFCTYSALQEDVVILRPILLKGTIFDEFDIECTGNNQQRTINKKRHWK